MGAGAWPFLVGGVICLVNSVNEQDLNMLNGIKWLYKLYTFFFNRRQISQDFLKQFFIGKTFINKIHKQS